jgi:uncharacterized repeat protein (TIGR03803 family)
MAHESQTFAWRLTLRDVLAVLLTAFALSVLGSHPALAQSFVPLYEFPNGQDGAIPYAGLTIDRAGNLYGTTEGGGICQPACGGIVFMLKNTRSGWLFTPIYTFARGNDGSTPEARVVFGPDGTLYGTTSDGGGVGCSGNGCGTVFNLRPPATACKTALCPWTETVEATWVQIPPPGLKHHATMPPTRKFSALIRFAKSSPPCARVRIGTSSTCWPKPG